FVEKTYKVFKEKGLVLSVVAVARSIDYENTNAFKNWSGVYDYKRLADSADFISLMVYDDPQSIGPVASLDFVNRTLDYVKDKIPAGKLSLGVPLYYWKWNMDTKKRVGSGFYSNIINIRANFRHRLGFDKTLGTSWLAYSYGNKNYAIWFEDKNSFQSRLEIITNKGLRGLIAKYVGSNDPYLSVIRALESAGHNNKVDIDIQIVEAEKLEKLSKSELNKIFKDFDGILVPGGFGLRGIEGKILAAKYARENKIPYLGLCLGMQVMLIEFARSILNLKDATSTEFDKDTKHPVIALIEEQKGITQKGGTMRLGVYPCDLVMGTSAKKIYKKDQVLERHRHRYEFNNKYRKMYEKAGVIFSGIYKKENLVEIAEIKDHPFMIASQFHPEFLSTPLKSHPLFSEFIRIVLKQKC
ncbi:MAG: CTP synthase, partial [bacterium]